ncbi:MAG: hypothetical protein D6805_02300 [Planctomycetota bacterium]|nr:MAG: hypothetical protein D6805_02300 [Planctomycetota bacterium]
MSPHYIPVPGADLSYHPPAPQTGGDWMFWLIPLLFWGSIFLACFLLWLAEVLFTSKSAAQKKIDHSLKKS